MVKSAFATLAAWLVASLLVHSALPVFAAIAGLLVVQPSVNQTVGKAIERSVGVTVGVLVAFVVGLVFGSGYWIVLAVIVVAIVVAWLLRLTPATAVQVPISAMLVLAIGSGDPQYSVDRIIETVIGAAIGILVNLFVVPPVLVRPARQKVDELLSEIANRLDAVADALSAPKSAAEMRELLLLARLMRPMLTAVDQAIADAEESLSLNPLRGRHLPALAEAKALRDRASALITQTLGVTRTLHDHYDAELVSEPTMPAIVDEVRRSAHDLRILGRPAPERPEPPALTAPLQVATPSATHWVVIGSLLEDLRRIHEEIAGEAT